MNRLVVLISVALCALAVVGGATAARSSDSITVVFPSGQDVAVAGDTISLSVVTSEDPRYWSVQVQCKQSGNVIYNAWRYPSGLTFTLWPNQFYDQARDARCEARLWTRGGRISASERFVLAVG